MITLAWPARQEHPWVTAGGQYLLPTEEENCVLIEVTEEEVQTCVRSIPKLETLILIKCMLKKHSFQNPFKMNILYKEQFARTGRSHSAPGSYEFYLERYGLWWWWHGQLRVSPPPHCAPALHASLAPCGVVLLLSVCVQSAIVVCVNVVFQEWQKYVCHINP